MSILVLGLGNVLLQDEGAGVRVIERLQAGFTFPEDVTVLDGGTLGLDLLHLLEGSRRAVIVDAVKAGKPAGTLVRLRNDEIPAFLGLKLSPHQVGLADILGLARLRGRLPDEVILWGVQAKDLTPGLALSPVVSAQVDTLAGHVLAELAAWGVTAVAKSCGLL